MNIVALNSSPRSGGESKTELMLDHLVKGMRDGGAEVNVVHLREKKIKSCVGCYTCWTKTPGQCIHRDDMSDDLFPKWLESDIAVYATPLYNYTMNATLKVFIERTLPSLEPFFKFHDGRMYHPMRHKIPGFVVLSVSGMPDKDHFKALSVLVNYFMATPGRKLLAEIYRPAAEIMTSPSFQKKAKEVLDATTQAGKELVRFLKISAETMDRITQSIVEENTFARMGNLYWKTCVAEGVTPKQFKTKKMIPRPDSLETFMKLLPSGINTESAGDKKAVLQFDFTGAVDDACYFIIQNGNIEAKSGPAATPDITIETPFDTWIDIMTGKADGQKLFMEQKYKVHGDIALMIQLFQKPK